MIEVARRRFITGGLATLFGAPAIVRAASFMAIKPVHPMVWQSLNETVWTVAYDVVPEGFGPWIPMENLVVLVNTLKPKALASRPNPCYSVS